MGLTLRQLRDRYANLERMVADMGFTPAPAQNASTATAFDQTITTAGTAKDLVTVPVGQIGRKISLINRGPGDARISFDTTATLTDILVKDGESYSEDGITVETKVSFINVTAKKPQLTGVLWSG